MENTRNVICIKWGSSDYYGARHVNRLYRSILENSSGKINFYCFTDDPEGLEAGIVPKAMVTLKNVEKTGCSIYNKEVGLCDDGLGGLEGQRVLYFDLDTVLVGNIDSFFEIPRGDEFYIIRDWNHGRNAAIGQASCYSWRVGTLGYVKSYFEEHWGEVHRKFGSASQEYLSSKVMEKFGKMNFWPDSWCRSFKCHCLPSPLIPFLRRFKMATIPAGARVICFHGRPKPEDAALGLWPERSWSKRLLYKHLRPVAWLEDYRAINFFK
ncbi:MAG: hypothetical protein LBU15_03060 [Rickettsiales bacterium]|jgi:hypothetical protein|nr:hypothetical protein [Rickettsiales bacterium]